MTVPDRSLRPLSRSDRWPAKQPTPLPIMPDAHPIPAGTVHLCCPAGLATGGPEAIHQLAAALNELGRDACVVYYDHQHPPIPARSGELCRFPPPPRPPVAAYAGYGARVSEVVVDAPDSLVVVPEVAQSLLPHFTRAGRAIWWLSLNNGVPATEALGGIGVLRQMRVLHFCQSAYAEMALMQGGLSDLYRLFDYTSDVFQGDLAPADRPPRVAYNPRKGRRVIERLQAAAPDIDWLPLTGMSPAEVRAALATCRLYVDFGPHPGKDRIPREAALCGCCVLTNRRGAAAVFSDLPIPERYKLDDAPEHDARTLATIREVLREHAQLQGDFDYWRRCIRSERAEFELQVRRIFGP